MRPFAGLLPFPFDCPRSSTLSRFPYADTAAGIADPVLRQRFVNATRYLTHMRPDEVLRVLRRRPGSYFR
ncbi:hypothetical protein CBR61_12680 [Porphyrobacter sp. CACIAM 03H1]|nr:hypothetical protein CBR61_12680 [Porphyrobacter sp. CACIAM 03H1]